MTKKQIEQQTEQPTLAEMDRRLEQAERDREAVAAEHARLKAEDNLRRDRDYAAWAERVVGSYRADHEAARRAIGEADTAMRDAYRAGDLAAVLVGWNARVAAQELDAALFHRQEVASYALPDGHPQRNNPQRTGDPGEDYWRETFSTTTDRLLQDLRAEAAEAAKAAVFADRPTPPDEGYVRPAPRVWPFGRDRQGRRYNKPTSTMTDEERREYETVFLPRELERERQAIERQTWGERPTPAAPPPELAKDRTPVPGAIVVTDEEARALEEQARRQAKRQEQAQAEADRAEQERREAFLKRQIEAHQREGKEAE